MARKLIHARIVHSQTDLGSVAENLAAERKRLSAEAWRDRQNKVAAFWAGLRTAVMESVERELGDAGWGKLRLYQDGMPVGGRTARRMVDELAGKGSVNYQILRELLDRGARLEKTEQVDLLREEYRLIRQIVDAPGPREKTQAQEAYRRRCRTLLAERDRFIAGRIAQTLREGEVGVLFIGALHQVASYLPGDIHVVSVS